MRALVTGAGGFIGSHTARQLAADGFEVLALVRPGARTDRLADAGASIRRLEYDLADAPGLAAALRAAPPTLCVHLAWYVAPDVHRATQNFACIGHGAELLRILDEVGCARSLLVGTYLEYDVSAGLLAETTPLRPQNVYAASKHALHCLADAYYGRQQGRSLAWARLFNVYGPHEYDGPLVAHLVRRLLDGQPCPLTSGEQRRDYLHVEDAARALSAIARSTLEGAVNVASGEDVPVATIARTIGELTGRGELLRFGAHPSAPHQAPRICGDVSRLRAATGFRPRYGLREGLTQTVEWWRANRANAAIP